MPTVHAAGPTHVLRRVYNTGSPLQLEGGDLGPVLLPLVPLVAQVQANPSSGQIIARSPGQSTVGCVTGGCRLLALDGPGTVRDKALT